MHVHVHNMMTLTYDLTSLLSAQVLYSKDHPVKVSNQTLIVGERMGESPSLELMGEGLEMSAGLIKVAGIELVKQKSHVHASAFANTSTFLTTRTKTFKKRK